MYITVLTVVHVIISLIGIGTGFIIVYGMSTNRRMDGWTAWFLATTVLTSATGYLFPFQKLLPSHIVGALSLVVLAAAIYARYPGALSGKWRTVYVVNATLAFYFNFFVLVAQAFRRIPILAAAAPTQQEPPFAIAQLVVLVAFLAAGTLAWRGFRPLIPAPAV